MKYLLFILGAIRVTQHPPIVLPESQIIEAETKSDEEASEPVSSDFKKPFQTNTLLIVTLNTVDRSGYECPPVFG